MNRVEFTKEMKKTHKILVPMMLPIHFQFLQNIFRQNGYQIELLQTKGQQIIDEGLKNVHNDTCYPALLVIGQMIDALNQETTIPITLLWPLPKPAVAAVPLTISICCERH